MISIAESDQDYDSNGADDTVNDESSHATNNCENNLHYLYIICICYKFFKFPILTTTFKNSFLRRSW
jgi:hypothetical protein